MCIILGVDPTSSHPTDTKIFNIPVYSKIDGDQFKSYNLMIYKNNLKFDNPNQNQFLSPKIDPILLNRTGLNSRQFETENLTNPNPNPNPNTEIMIVVVPTDPNIDVGFIDISNPNVKELCSTLVSEGKKLIDYDSLKKSKSRSLGLDSSRSYSSNNSVAMVHRVGNYDISAVYRPEDLYTKIDWNRFTKPADLDQRIQTIMNKRLFPFINDAGEGGAIIICKAINEITDDGFGVIYRSTDITKYYPTCHEDSPETKSYIYDVKLYGLVANPPDQLNQRIFELDSIYQYTDNIGTVIAMSNNMARSMVGSLNVSYAKRLSDMFGLQRVVFASDGVESYICLDTSKMKYLEHIPIKSSGPNQNIIV